MTNHLGFPLETVAVFAVLSMGAIAIDLFAHRSDQPMSFKSASLWSIFWILVSLAFGGYLWIHHDSETASLFFTGYALEKVLSVDNLFVIMAVFSWFNVPEGYRHRVLYWGIIGAIVFRMIFVAIGTSLLALGPYVEILFALIVGWTAVMMLRRDDEAEADEDYSEHLAYRGYTASSRYGRAFMGITSSYAGTSWRKRAACTRMCASSRPVKTSSIPNTITLNPSRKVHWWQRRCFCVWPSSSLRM